MAVARPMTEPGSVEVDDLYERDYHAWIMRQAAALREGRVGDLDIINLLDEVEDLGKSERRAVLSRLELVMVHLLKWMFQPERRGRSWESTIREQRKRLARLLAENPSLKALPAAEFDTVYETAVIVAAREMERDEADLPGKAPFTVEQALDEDHWPSAKT